MWPKLGQGVAKKRLFAETAAIFSFVICSLLIVVARTTTDNYTTVA
jgi:hypothetical protein